MSVSSYMLRDFFSIDPMRKKIVAAVEAAGFTVTFIESRQDANKWGLLLRSNRSLAELFQLDREVLLWCTMYPTFLARDLSDLKSFIGKMCGRITHNFAILVAKYPADARSALEAELDSTTTIVHCAIEELLLSNSKSSPLLRLLREQLYTRDLYDQPGAIVRAGEFFGRRSLIDNITAEITAGRTQIGLFGVRKVGKTSLVNKLMQAVMQSGRCMVGKVDLQLTTSVSPEPEYTLWAVGEAILASGGRAARRLKGLRLFGQYATASDAKNSAISIWELFAHDLTLLMDAVPNRKIVIFFDEIERLLATDARPAFIRIWRLLRGLDQQHPGRLRYIISGTSPECAELPLMGTEDNPLYQYLAVHYVGPLGKGDTCGLIEALGRNIGLRWSSEALEYMYEQTGGHPGLTRILGSTIHLQLSPRTEAIQVDLPIVRVAARKVLSERSATLAQVVASLKDKHPDEYVLLETLSRGEISDFRELARSYPDDFSHLNGYGLLADGAQSSKLSMALLQTYIISAREARASAVRSQTGIIGEIIGEWKVYSRISSGGFADVYLAENISNGDRVAMKVFRQGLLSALEREVEYLQMLDYPGIVNFIEVTESAGGSPCLIMDYIVGRPLSDYCNPTSRLNSNELVAISRSLLNALAYMHPNASRAAMFERKSELTPFEFQMWELSKHGVIHRDIKPESIILRANGGPVLIDFNIAVKAAQPVLTITATPGYLPPDFDGISWTPSVDIYQLGITLIQLAAANRYDRNLEDLVASGRARHEDELIDWIHAMITAPKNAVGALISLDGFSKKYEVI